METVANLDLEIQFGIATKIQFGSNVTHQYHCSSQLVPSLDRREEVSNYVVTILINFLSLSKQAPPPGSLLCQKYLFPTLHLFPSFKIPNSLLHHCSLSLVIVSPYQAQLLGIQFSYLVLRLLSIILILILYHQIPSNLFLFSSICLSVDSAFGRSTKSSLLILPLLFLLLLLLSPHHPPPFPDQVVSWLIGGNKDISRAEEATVGVTNTSTTGSSTQAQASTGSGTLEEEQGWVYYRGEAQIKCKV